MSVGILSSGAVIFVKVDEGDVFINIDDLDDESVSASIWLDAQDAAALVRQLQEAIDVLSRALEKT